MAAEEADVRTKSGRAAPCYTPPQPPPGTYIPANFPQRLGLPPPLHVHSPVHAKHLPGDV